MAEDIITFEGVEDLVAKLKDLGGIITDVKKDAVTAMIRVRAAARNNVPVESALLQKNIIVKDESIPGGLAVYCGIFSPKVNYAIYVEYGTGIYAENGQGRKDPWIAPMVIDGEDVFRWTQGMHPQPFLRPAWDEKKGEVLEIVKNAMKKRIGELTT
jgi:HK97 gp10 family phage protein